MQQVAHPTSAKTNRMIRYTTNVPGFARMSAQTILKASPQRTWRTY